MTEKEEWEHRLEVWNEAAAWGYAKAFNELYYRTDKHPVLMALFRKAQLLGEETRDKKKAAEWEAYSEGFRHAINILENLGDALGAYKGIINPSIKLDLTEEDVKRLGRD